jgi:hypothetical protein
MLKTVEKRFNNGYVTSVTTIYHFDTDEEAAAFRDGWENEKREHPGKMRLVDYSPREPMFRKLYKRAGKRN